jgi:nucleoside-diphosphate-sugar epimerase
VTGASGYIASWITLYLLEAGFAVRGTTRTAAKGQWMKDMYAARGLDKFEYAVVSDLENEGAFDEAVQGAEYVHP